MDEDVLDRSVFASQRRLEVVDYLAAHESVPELVETIALCIKFSEMMPDVFVGGVAEQFQLGGICPENFTVGTDLVETFERVLDEIGKLLLTKMKRLFSFLASGFLGVEHSGFLLQQTYRAKTFGLGGQCAIALGGQHRSMICAHLKKQRRVGVGAEAVQRIRAAQRQRVRLHERVPQFLEADGSLAVSVGPQERNHLAECAEFARLVHACDNALDGAREQPFVRPFVNHEGRKRLGGIAADEAALLVEPVEIDAPGCEMFFEADPMRFGPDVHATVADTEAIGEPMRQRIDEEAVILVELNQMRVGIDVRPRARRGKGGRKRSRE